MSTETSPEDHNSPAAAFDELVGAELSSVEFVQDYVQLRFSPLRRLSLCNPHTIVVNGVDTVIDNGRGIPINRQSRECQPAICDRIGHRILSARLDEEKAADD